VRVQVSLYKPCFLGVSNHSSVFLKLSTQSIVSHF